MNKINNKSQVTIIVIVALLVVIIAGFVIYSVTKSKQSVVSNPVHSDVSAEFKPIQQYVEDCIQQLGLDGVKKIGAHGGYIDPNDEFLSGRNFVMNPDVQTESDFAFLSPKDYSTAVAYWYYSLSSKNCKNCIMISQTPFIPEMERQLAIYVGNNIDNCLDNFTTFKDQGYEISYSQNISVTATIRDNDVLFNVEYPMTVSKQNSKASMDQFYSIVDIPLKKYYDMAVNITQKEMRYGYLEKMDNYLINYYSGLNSNMLPPTYAFTENYDIHFWSQTASRQKFENLIKQYLPLIRVPNTKNYVDVNGKDINGNNINGKDMALIEANFYKSMSLNLFEGAENKNTEINFAYPGSGITMSISPSQGANGELIGPFQSTSDGSVSMVPPEQTNSYNYFYDLSYPVIVEINDEYKPLEHYTFLFALQSNIKDNLNLRDWWNESLRPLYFDSSYLQATLTDPNIGSIITDPSNPENKYAYKERVAKTLFCDPIQRTSGNITMKTFDASTNHPLDLVSVSFGCGDYSVCALGQSTYDITTNTSSFNKAMPVCLNGYVFLQKFGYQTRYLPLTTESGVKKNLGSIFMEPIVSKNISINKYSMIRKYNGAYFEGNVLQNYSTPLSDKDSVILTFTKLSSSVIDPPYTQTIILGMNQTSASIDMLPGRYTLDANLLDYNGIIIKKECKEVCVNKNILGMCTDTKKIPDADINIPIAMWGGLIFDQKNPVIISRDDLLSNKTLQISVVRIPNPRCIDDMQEVGQLGQISSRYRSVLTPRFV